MKKVLSLIITFAMLFAALSAFSFTVQADFPNPDEMMLGYENLVLTYTHNPNRADKGAHNVEDLKPYVGYYDANGQIIDYFFDSYLFLPCVANGITGARLHYDPANPTKAADWIDYVEGTFTEGLNVDALEVAFGNAKQELGDTSDKKAGVVLTILYPGVDAKSNFGALGGKSLDFSKMEDRKYAIKWIIDEQLKLYNERDYQNLELIGFYWLEEYLYSGAQGNIDKELFKYASDYLHSLGLKFVWIPWYCSNGYDKWQELGVDAITMQPNMFWQQVADRNRVGDCLVYCENLGMGMEMEVSNSVFSSSEYFNRYLDYLQGGVESGAMNSVKMYYQDGKEGVYFNAYNSDNERGRAVYDLTYKYAKGILTLDDINSFRSPQFELPGNVKWRSIGKKYVATQAYTDGSSLGYQQIDGKELTDGVIGVSELDTEWHGFHKTLLDPDGRMSATIDLGAIYTDLTHFVGHFSHVQAHGIADPRDIRIEISTDGENYTLLATPEIETRDIAAYVIYHTEPVSARYVKFSFMNSSANFVFCSEVMAGAGEAPVDTPDESIGATDDASNEESESSATSDDEIEKKSNWYIWVIVAIAAAIVVGAVIFTVNKKNKK